MDHAELRGRIAGHAVALVARVVAARPEGSWTELELKTAVQELIEEYEGRGRKVYIPRRNREYAIEVGLRMLTLRHVLDEDDGLYRLRDGELPLVRYYAHSLGPL